MPILTNVYSDRTKGFATSFYISPAITKEKISIHSRNDYDFTMWMHTHWRIYDWIFTKFTKNTD